MSLEISPDTAPAHVRWSFLNVFPLATRASKTEKHLQAICATSLDRTPPLSREPSAEQEVDDYCVKSTVTELERLSLGAVAAMNFRDWELEQTPEARELLAHISSNWTSKFDNYQHPLGFEEHLEAHREFVRQNPKGSYEVQWIFTTFAGSGDNASVFLQIDIRMEGGMTIEGFAEFKWKLVGGKWLWYHHHAMRGMVTG